MDVKAITILRFNLTYDEKNKYDRAYHTLCVLRNKLYEYPSFSNEYKLIADATELLLSIIEDGQIKSH